MADSNGSVSATSAAELLLSVAAVEAATRAGPVAEPRAPTAGAPVIVTARGRGSVPSEPTGATPSGAGVVPVTGSTSHAATSARGITGTAQAVASGQQVAAGAAAGQTSGQQAGSAGGSPARSSVPVLAPGVQRAGQSVSEPGSPASQASSASRKPRAKRRTIRYV